MYHKAFLFILLVFLLGVYPDLALASGWRPLGGFKAK